MPLRMFTSHLFSLASLPLGAPRDNRDGRDDVLGGTRKPSQPSRSSRFGWQEGQFDVSAAVLSPVFILNPVFMQQPTGPDI